MNGAQPSPVPTSQEAKRNLLECGRTADAEIIAQVHSTVDSYISAARKALPWIGGLAAVAGILLATRKKRPKASAGHGARDARLGAGLGGAMGLLTLALKFAPLALGLLRKGSNDQHRDPR